MITLGVDTSPSVTVCHCLVVRRAIHTRCISRPSRSPHNHQPTTHHPLCLPSSSATLQVPVLRLRGHVGSSSSQPILSTRCHNRAGPATCESDWGSQPEKFGDRARRRGREKEREGKGESERERERRGERKRERERREGEGQPARPPTLTDGAPNVPCIFIETDTSEDPSKWL